MNRYLDEVLELHVRIEAFFTKGEGSVESLMKHFHPDFSMVTTGGDRVCLAGVSHMFGLRIGSQPDLVIALDELETLAEWHDGALVGYREIHLMENVASQARRSTALFTLEGGRVLWRHLQETWSNDLA